MAHILIIEDDDSLRGMMALVLQAEGHTVAQAADGREGLARHRECRADVVATDVIMPTMDGLETITALRDITPNLPIVAMSGTTEHELYLRMSALLGAQRTLAKPFSRTALLRAIHEALEAARAGLPVRPPTINPFEKRGPYASASSLYA